MISRGFSIRVDGPYRFEEYQINRGSKPDRWNICVGPSGNSIVKPDRDHMGLNDDCATFFECFETVKRLLLSAHEERLSEAQRYVANADATLAQIEAALSMENPK